MLDNLFKFPILMVDAADAEKNKNLRPSYEDDELDIIIGEAEMPYQDFVSILDRWMPNRESLERAREGDFDACYVTFQGSGSFLVPWKKERFKKEFVKFVSGLMEVNDGPNVKLITNKQDLKDLLEQLPDGEESKDE